MSTRLPVESYPFNVYVESEESGPIGSESIAAVLEKLGPTTETLVHPEVFQEIVVLPFVATLEAPVLNELSVHDDPPPVPPPVTVTVIYCGASEPAVSV